MQKQKTAKTVLFVISFILLLSMMVGLICNALSHSNAQEIDTHTEVGVSICEHQHGSHTQNLLATSIVELNKNNTQILQGSATTATDNPSKCSVCDCRIYACSVCWMKDTVTDGSPQTYSTETKHVGFTGDNKNHNLCSNNIINQSWYKSLSKVIDIVDSLMVPILVVIGTAGAIFVIVLGVNYSKAESADKREEAKKRMIGAIIGVVVMLILLVIIKLFTANAYSILKWINGQ